MRNFLPFTVCLFTSINIANAKVPKEGGKITFMGQVVNSELYVSNDTNRVILLNELNPSSTQSTPFQVKFTGCQDKQCPNISYSIYDVNTNKNTKLISTYIKNNDPVLPNVSLELLDDNNQAIHVAGKHYLLEENAINKNLNFSARYIVKNNIEAEKKVNSMIVFAINYH